MKRDEGTVRRGTRGNLTYDPSRGDAAFHHLAILGPMSISFTLLV